MLWLNYYTNIYPDMQQTYQVFLLLSVSILHITHILSYNKKKYQQSQ